jgi:hypothetical protein
MMSTTLATIVQLANDRRRDATSNSIDMTGDGFRAINGALEVWDQQHDWPWQITKTSIVYNEGITWYPLAASLSFKSVVSVEPYVPRLQADQFYYISSSKFDSDFIHSWKFAVDTLTQNQYLRLKYSGGYLQLNQATQVTANGTWTGATAISNLTDDSYGGFEYQACIKFDYSGTTGTLTNSTMTVVDVSRFAQNSHIYFDVYLQSVTNFTGFTLKVGTDSSNYITASGTTDYLGNTPVVGWNRFKIAWNGTTTVVGTLTTTSFQYIQLTLTYSVNPATAGNKFSYFFISEDVPVNLTYYSHFMTIDASASNAPAQVFTDATATTDPALWTDRWDFVNEAYINSVMEIINWMTGEQEDRNVAIQRIQAFVEPLKSKLPGKRLYPEMAIVADLNIANSGYPYGRRWPWRG